MATFKPSISSISSSTYLGTTRASTHTHQSLQETKVSIPRYSIKDPSVVGLNKQNNQTHAIKTNREKKEECSRPNSSLVEECSRPNLSLVEELYAIMDIVADRVEMHKNIGEQRNNWNHLLLTSVNSMTVTAAIMAGIAAAGTEAGSAVLPLKLSSAVLYLGATGILIIMNKIQPSQLAEEQRSASRLFKNLHTEISSNIALKRTNSSDVVRIIDKVLALDKAYPLPLLGVMLEKFPKRVEPAVWWPQHMDQSHNSRPTLKGVENGWSQGLEEEMREIVSVLRRKDHVEYIKLGKIVLKMNKILAICGPMLTGLAATGVAFTGSPLLGSMPSLLGIVFGALATIVNTIEHGGQMGMVFEMYRSSAGFFKLMEENIESTLEQRQEIRENGQLFEETVALKLGRNLSELRDLASASSSRIPTSQEFASKLF